MFLTKSTSPMAADFQLVFNRAMALSAGQKAEMPAGSGPRDVSFVANLGQLPSGKDAYFVKANEYAFLATDGADPQVSVFKPEFRRDGDTTVYTPSEVIGNEKIASQGGRGKTAEIIVNDSSHQVYGGEEHHFLNIVLPYSPYSEDGSRYVVGAQQEFTVLNDVQDALAVDLADPTAQRLVEAWYRGAGIMVPESVVSSEEISAKEPFAPMDFALLAYAILFPDFHQNLAKEAMDSESFADFCDRFAKKKTEYDARRIQFWDQMIPYGLKNMGQENSFVRVYEEMGRSALDYFRLYFAARDEKGLAGRHRYYNGSEWRKKAKAIPDSSESPVLELSRQPTLYGDFTGYNRDEWSDHQMSRGIVRPDEPDNVKSRFRSLKDALLSDVLRKRKNLPRDLTAQVLTSLLDSVATYGSFLKTYQELMPTILSDQEMWRIFVIRMCGEVTMEGERIPWGGLESFSAFKRHLPADKALDFETLKQATYLWDLQGKIVKRGDLEELYDQLRAGKLDLNQIYAEKDRVKAKNKAEDERQELLKRVAALEAKANPSHSKRWRPTQQVLERMFPGDDLPEAAWDEMQGHGDRTYDDYD